MFFLICEEKTKCKNKHSILCHSCSRNKKDYFEPEGDKLKVKIDRIYASKTKEENENE